MNGGKRAEFVLTHGLYGFSQTSQPSSMGTLPFKENRRILRLLTHDRFI